MDRYTVRNGDSGSSRQGRCAGRTLTRANPRSFAPSLWWPRHSRCNLPGVTRIPLGLLLTLVPALLGCRVYSVGLPTDATAGDFVGMGLRDSGGAGERAVVDALGEPGNIDIG